MHRLLLTVMAFFALAAPAHAAWAWPVDGEVITPYRNGTDPYASGQHRGIDIAASAGTPVVAAAGGDVRFAGTAGSSGLTISVRTSDGYDTSYLHLSSLAVRAGARVSAGERIGAVGTTGTRSAAEPHLHFGVRDAGARHAYRDPLAFLPPPAATRSPEPPPGAPAPVPAPAPPAAVPQPAPSPRQAPRAAPRPVPRSVPRSAPRPAPARRRAPHRVPALLRTRRPAPALGRAPHAAPAGRPDPTPVRGGSREPAPAPQPPGRAGAPRIGPAHPALGAGPRLAARATSAPSGPVRADATGGPDIGWALACAGLLLAAGILALTNDGRGVRSRRGGRLAGMLPMLGRRQRASWQARVAKSATFRCHPGERG